jgi:hypothetical protein
MNPSDQSLNEAIENLARVERVTYCGTMLWCLVKSYAGLGTRKAKKICVLAGYDPYQIIGKGPLKPCKE